jgi:hypothetical protein
MGGPAERAAAEPRRRSARTRADANLVVEPSAIYAATWPCARRISLGAMPTTSRRSFGASTKYQPVTSRAASPHGPGPVAEELADHRERGVRHGAGVRQPFDRRPVRSLGTATDCVGHELRLVAALERLDRREGQADFRCASRRRSAACAPSPRPPHGTPRRRTRSWTTGRSARRCPARPRSRAALGCEPVFDPEVDSTIGTSNALAALASQRTWSSTRSA